MSDDAAGALVQRLIDARRQWVPVAPGVELQVQRPTEGRMLRGLDIDTVAGCVVGWRGVTLGHLLGDAAADDERDRPAPFGEALRDAALPDQAGWLAAVAEALRAAIERRAQALEAARGN